MKEIPAIIMENISKSFGAVKANEDVSLTVNNGEIHALLGENGAGKSTLMNMLSGIYNPDSGSVFIQGEKVDFASPNDSIAMGIGMIHQHFKLIDVLTVLASKRTQIPGRTPLRQKSRSTPKITHKIGRAHV